MASLEAVEPVVVGPADLRLGMTGWTRSAVGRRELWPMRGPGGCPVFPSADLWSGW